MNNHVLFVYNKVSYVFITIPLLLKGKQIKRETLKMYYIYNGAIMTTCRTVKPSQAAFEKTHAQLSYLPLLPLD